VQIARLLHAHEILPKRPGRRRNRHRGPAMTPPTMCWWAPWSGRTCGRSGSSPRTSWTRRWAGTRNGGDGAAAWTLARRGPSEDAGVAGANPTKVG